MNDSSLSSNPKPADGVRERKRRETLNRIAETGLRLFLTQGYEATTLDAIAEAAGISRRTFFSYFKSKDDIVMLWLRAGWASLNEELLKTSPDEQPLNAVRDLLVKFSARYTTDEMTAIDNLMRSSDSLRARKQAFYGEQEQALFATLCEVWRQPERRTGLRMVAMMTLGVMRLATQAWHDQVGQNKPMGRCMKDAFDALKAEVR